MKKIYSTLAFLLACAAVVLSGGCVLTSPLTGNAYTVTTDKPVVFRGPVTGTEYTIELDQQPGGEPKLVPDAPTVVTPMRGVEGVNDGAPQH